MHVVRTEVHQQLQFSLHPGDLLVIAVSGGPDSTALAAASVSVSEDLGIHTIMAHYDHRLRGDAASDRDLNSVRNLAARLHTELFVGAAVPEEIRRDANRYGMEAAARRHRYRFLADAARQHGATAVAVGHTLDDQLETVILRLFTGRGASVTGLRGMPSSRVIDSGSPEVLLLRPLLDLDRATVHRYVEQQRLTPVTDESNNDCAFARNAVRHELLPVVERLFPHWRSALPSLLKRQAMLGEALEELSAQAVTWREGDRGLVANLQDLLALPTGARVVALRQAAWRVATVVPPTEFFMPICGARSVGDVPRRLIGHGVEYWVRGSELVVGRAPPEHLRATRGAAGSGFWARLEDRHTVALPGGTLMTLGEASPHPANVVHLAGARLPLVVRSRRPGDMVRTAGGSRPVNKLLSEMGVTEQRRDKVPLIEDTVGVLAVVGSVVGAENLVAQRDHTAARVVVTIGRRDADE